ncbi:hypothetical protein [Chryseobacterium sp. JK1]|uniref:hypothetical protein n=1 Tax=Chryseobacterium sp. JK1 TaxID=874294 RepID=UPI003D685174
MKLISMTEFVQQQKVGRSENYTPLEDYIRSIEKYAMFLRQPLTLAMFVSVDETGNILEKPVHYEEWLSEYNRGFNHDFEALIQNEFRKAKEKVLFEIPRDNIEVHEDAIMFNDNRFIVSRKTGKLMYFKKTASTIEDIANDPDVKFYLTPSAIKQIGL